MKKIILLFLITTLYSNKSNAQEIKNELVSESQLKEVLETYTNSLIKKDSLAYFNLFNENPIPFVRIYNKNPQDGLIQKKNKIKADYYNEDYKKYFRAITKNGFTEKKTSTIIYKQDDYSATIDFDYSYWKEEKKINWGKETWGLIYKNRSWRITRVFYSMELEKDNPEPSMATKK
ncbi:hypothetical protein [Flavobacterium sp. N3904]|uniref:hypothetical protein n=1 Tax=Flavobacterium sp. N3904 TaxID=2986835 RepID=UPI0022247B66|nr:hypothetical protein [Flavobacterium sp. N3904]